MTFQWFANPVPQVIEVTPCVARHVSQARNAVYRVGVLREVPTQVSLVTLIDIARDEAPAHLNTSTSMAGTLIYDRRGANTISGRLSLGAI